MWERLYSYVLLVNVHCQASTGAKARIVAQEAYEHRLSQQQAEIDKLKEAIWQLNAQKQSEEAILAAQMQAANEAASHQRHHAENLSQQNAQQQQYINKLEELQDAQGKGKAKAKANVTVESEDESVHSFGDDEHSDDGELLPDVKDDGTDDEMPRNLQKPQVCLVQAQLFQLHTYPILRYN